MANLIEQMNVLKGLDDSALQGEIQSPSGAAPPFLVLTELSRRKDMRQRYEGEKARQKPSTTVVEDISFGLPAQPASMQGGLSDAMGSTTQGFATGGLVEAVPGYADGGAVDYADIASRYNERLSGLGADKDRARALALLAASGAIMGGGSSNTLRNVGGGISAFAGSYGDQLKGIDSEELALLRGITDIGQAQSQMDLAQLDQALRERELALRSSGGDESFYSPVPGTIEGKPAYVQFGNRGGVRPAVVPEGFTPQSRYEKIDAGDHWIIKDTTTGQTEIVLKQGTPGANMNVEGIGSERVMTPAPGSSEALERQAAAEKAAAADASAAQTADIVTTDIDRAIQSIEANPAMTTGVGAALTENIGFGPAFDVKSLLSPVEAAISFDKLQAMRDASPTGGALGQVSTFEINLLKQAYGSVALSQNKEQLIYNLERLKELYTKVVNEGIDDPSSSASPSGTEDIDALANKYLTP